MVNRICYTFSKVIRYIFNEIIIKFLFCYLISIFALSSANKIEHKLTQSIIINVASALISIPIVFIVHDLYNKILVFKSTKLINQTVDKEISNIFSKFLYFSTYFYNEFKNERDLSELDELLKKTKDVIFSDVSRNKHHGYFVFSVFDNFDEHIDNVLNSNKIIKFISSKEVAVLQTFINDYKHFLEIFSLISNEDFIKHEKILDTHLRKSTIANSSDENIAFYDIFNTNGESTVTYYCAKYRIYEEEPLTYTYKMSGNKAKEISILLHNLYSSINKWKKMRGIKELEFDNALVSCGRLYLEDNITINTHMNDGISMYGVF